MKNIKQTADFDQNADRLNDLASIKELHLNFRRVPLRTVLNYLQEATDLPIQVESNVEIERAIELWSDEPVNKEEALQLLKRALNDEGYTAIRKRGVLAIIKSQDAKKHYIPLPTLTCVAAVV